MKVLSMTATFGKLEHQTLTLESGLNIIDAPNEWGKSTWCAFLLTMLYGLDTRERSTKTSLADKERYAPWSGSPMSGRMELEWEGRCITIERQSKGRTPMGVFRAYETDSGLPVTELTAANCGQVLLGVERGVFSRAGFLRSGDMPVGMNEELRRRLNGLVTTGDDSAMADELGQKLRDLKNRCRYNRSGLIPQAESRRDALEAQLREYEELEQQILGLERQLQQREAAANPDPQKLEQAIRQEEQARTRYQELERKCAAPQPKKPKRAVLLILGAACLILGIALVKMWVGWLFLAAVPVLCIAGLCQKSEVEDRWDQLEMARRDYDEARLQVRQLQQSDGTLAEQLRRLHLQLGQCQGRMASIGDPEELRRQLQAVRLRIQELEQTEQALAVALQALSDARQELQRRFAPGIAKRAQELFARLTQGRYDRLSLGEDLAVLVSAKEEDGLRSPLWRSEGTADQLYLALRLAVAEELTPNAPLILDDALIRFDDSRLAICLDILEELSKEKQVIVFSCRRL